MCAIYLLYQKNVVMSGSMVIVKNVKKKIEYALVVLPPCLNADHVLSDHSRRMLKQTYSLPLTFVYLLIHFKPQLIFLQVDSVI